MIFQTTLLAAVCPSWFLEHFSFSSLIFLSDFHGYVSMTLQKSVRSMLSNTWLVKRRGKVFSCTWMRASPLHMHTHAHPHLPMYTHVASSTAHRNSQPQADLPTWVIIALPSTRPLWIIQLIFVKNNSKLSVPLQIQKSNYSLETGCLIGRESCFKL